jgi:hypothetical protein
LSYIKLDGEIIIYKGAKEMSRQYAEMYYRQDEKRWVIAQPESVGILMVDTTDYMLALNEASRNGWDLLTRTDNKYIMYRELPETPFSDSLIERVTKEITEKYNDLEKRFESVEKAYRMATNVILDRNTIIKALLLEGRDSISVTGEFEETIKKSNLDSYSITCTIKEVDNKLKINAWLEEYEEQGDE